MFLPKNIRHFAIGEIKYLPALSLNERVASLSILFRWSHSVWRLLWKDFLVFITMYTFLTLFYDYVASQNITLKQTVDGVLTYVNKISSLIPLSFLLGFFVSAILSRWWQIIMVVPWMAGPAFLTQSLLNTPTTLLVPDMTLKEQARTLRNVRLTVMRYMNMAWIFQMCNLSRQVKQRFKPYAPKASLGLCFMKARGRKKSLSGLPTECTHNSAIYSSVNMAPQSCVRRRLEAINQDPIVSKFFTPLITPQEIKVLERMELEFRQTSKRHYKPEMWIPLQWASRILNHTKEVGLFIDDRHFVELTKMLENFRNNLALLYIYNEFNIPLGYSQVVIIAVYTFFLSELFAQQYLDMSSSEYKKGFQLDKYFPIFSVLKFIFYMGWYKMGLSLINPLIGDKESGFPMSDILNFNLQISSQIVPADNIIFPNYLNTKAGSAKEQLLLLNSLSNEEPFSSSTRDMGHPHPHGNHPPHVHKERC